MMRTLKVYQMSRLLAVLRVGVRESSGSVQTPASAAAAVPVGQAGRSAATPELLLKCQNKIRNQDSSVPSLFHPGALIQMAGVVKRVTRGGRGGHGRALEVAAWT